MHPDLSLLDDIGHPPVDGHPQEIAQFDIDTTVAFVHLLHVLKLERNGLHVAHLTGARQLLDERQKLVVISAVEEQFFVSLATYQYIQLARF